MGSIRTFSRHRPGRSGISSYRHPRTIGLLLVLLLVHLLAPISAPAAGGKRVLIVHSFGSAAPPFTTGSTAFAAELTERMGEQVDLDEVSLDMARFSDADAQEALVEYLQKRQAKWQPDLVVPFGSPAGIFVAQYRERLFPDTPILYTALDRRRLPPNALAKNATFLGENYNLSGFVDDILQIAPATTNIAVVIGASALEQYWTAAFRREFESYTNRVGFTWLNDLSFDQMLERVSKLPPRSFIFLILLLRDATGVTHNADEALKRLHAAANAPINGIFQSQLGLGIVGGRLYPDEAEGVESAHLAIRILHGEAASSLPPKIVEASGPQYDWRELQRWKISLDHLPPGAVIRFRELTVWDRYRSWIVAGTSVCVVEALFIMVLVYYITARKKAEARARESEREFLLIADAAPVLIWASGPDKLCTFFNLTWLEFTGRQLEQELGNGWTSGVHPDDLAACMKNYVEAFDSRQPFTMEYRLRRHDGQFRWISDTGVPRYGTQRDFLGYIGSCVDVTERKEAEAEAQRTRQELAHVSRVATMGELAGSLAHELNQPLTAILSNAQAALRFLDGERANLQEVREILRDIVEEDQRAGAVIVRMRAMLKKEEAKLLPQDLNQIVEEVLGLMRSELVVRKAAATTRLAPGLPEVLGDRVQLQQVLLNLIVNACDAMSANPEPERQLTIGTELVEGGFVQTAVADRGPGFPPEALQREFEPFRTTKPNGLGLGLPICQSILSSHGGRLWVANNSDRGATVRFTLAAQNEAP